MSKLDLSNKQQVEMMWGSYYSHNLAAVNFWLTFCVLPSETRQYPQRLACSAWHLAQSGSGLVAGFSGTNDNHCLLPLQVRQYLPTHLPTQVRAGVFSLSRFLQLGFYGFSGFMVLKCTSICSRRTHMGRGSICPRRAHLGRGSGQSWRCMARMGKCWT